jgi:pre-mRNA-processing factor 6
MYGGMQTPLGNGMMTPISGTQTVGLSEARGTMLSSKLDKMSDSVSGQTVVDPKGYLTDLNSLRITSDAEVGDIKKARTLLTSVTTTNPKHGPGMNDSTIPLRISVMASVTQRYPQGLTRTSHIHSSSYL